MGNNRKQFSFLTVSSINPDSENSKDAPSFARQAKCAPIRRGRLLLVNDHENITTLIILNSEFCFLSSVLKRLPDAEEKCAGIFARPPVELVSVIET